MFLPCLTRYHVIHPLALSLTSSPVCNPFQPHSPLLCFVDNNAGFFHLLFSLLGISFHRYLYTYSFISFKSVFNCHYHKQDCSDHCLTVSLVILLHLPLLCMTILLTCLCLFIICFPYLSAIYMTAEILPVLITLYPQ